MTAFKPAYRLRMYAPRSVDATEATVLTPAAGAAHSDAFQVASIAGVAGYQPYLHDVPQGRRGRIDLRSKKLDIGSWVFMLIDKRLTATDNLTRWWSAFFGDIKGKPPGRLRIEVDESLDKGASWSRFVTGELVGTRLQANKVDIQLSVYDRVETLKMRVFVGQPAASLSYVSQPTLLPVGFRLASYGKLVITPPLTGSMIQSIFNGVNYSPSGECILSLDAPSRSNKTYNIVTKNLVEVLAPHSITASPGQGNVDLHFLPNFNGTARCHVKRLDTNAEGDFRVGGLQIQTDVFNSVRHSQVVLMPLHELASGDVGYMAVPPNGTSVEFYVYVDQAVTDNQPLLIGDVDPATYIQDLCAGKFGYLYRAPDTLPSGKSYGDPVRTQATNGIGALVGTRPVMRKPVTEPSSAIDEIEQVCREQDWAPYLDAQGQLNIVDLRLPTTLAGIATLTDTDVVADADPSWEHDPTQAVLRLELTHYSERIVTGETDLWRQPDDVPVFPGASFAIEETAHPIEPLYIGSIDYGDNVEKIDGKGYRSMDGEQYQSQPRSDYMAAALEEVGGQLQRPFAYGLTSMALPCRRTATVTGLTQGGLVLLSVSSVPDPATHKRGTSSRLCRVLELSQDGPIVTVKLADIAVNVFAGVPTIGAPAQETGNTYGGVTVTVTLNASSQPVDVRCAVTDTSVGSAPADTSPLWTFAGTKLPDTSIRLLRRRLAAGATFAIRGLPNGKRIWVDGRSMPFASDAQLPSAWVLAGGSGFVDLASLDVVTVLGAVKTHKTATLSWTNGKTDLLIEILLATPTSDPRTRIAVILPGSTSYVITGLTPSTQYRAEVRYIMGESPGTGATVDFTTDASGGTCPDIARFQIIGPT